MTSQKKLIEGQIGVMLSAVIKYHTIKEFSFDRKVGMFGALLLDRNLALSVANCDTLNYEVKNKSIIIKYEDLVLNYLEVLEQKKFIDPINLKLDDNFHINKNILNNGRIISILLRNDVFCKKEHIDFLYKQNRWFVDAVRKIDSEDLLTKLFILHPDSLPNLNKNYLNNIVIKNIGKNKAKDFFINSKLHLSSPKLIKCFLELDVSLFNLFQFDDIKQLSRSEPGIFGILIKNIKEINFDKELIINYLKENKDNTNFVKDLLNSTYLVESSIGRLLNKEKLINQEIENDLDYLNELVFKNGRKDILEVFTNIKPGTITNEKSIEISKNNKYNALEYFDKKLLDKNVYKNIILLNSNKALTFQDEISKHHDLLSLFFKTHWKNNTKYIQTCYKTLLNAFCPSHLEAIDEQSAYVNSLLLHEELNNNLSKNGIKESKLKI